MVTSCYYISGISENPVRVKTTDQAVAVVVDLYAVQEWSAGFAPPPLQTSAGDEGWDRQACSQLRWSECQHYIGPKSTTKRPRKTEIGTKVSHVTRVWDTTFKVKRSKIKVTRPLYSARP